MRCPRCGKELESSSKICPNCKKLRVDGVSGESRYTDVLKPNSSISVKGFGSKMSGPSKVTATRHKITDSDEGDSSQKIRCLKCGTVNEKSDQYCRKCGSRITS